MSGCEAILVKPRTDLENEALVASLACDSCQFRTDSRMLIVGPAVGRTLFGVCERVSSSSFDTARLGRSFVESLESNPAKAHVFAFLASRSDPFTAKQMDRFLVSNGFSNNSASWLARLETGNYVDVLRTRELFRINVYQPSQDVPWEDIANMEPVQEALQNMQPVDRFEQERLF